MYSLVVRVTTRFVKVESKLPIAWRQDNLVYFNPTKTQIVNTVRSGLAVFTIDIDGVVSHGCDTITAYYEEGREHVCHRRQKTYGI